MSYNPGHMSKKFILDLKAEFGKVGKGGEQPPLDTSLLRYQWCDIFEDFCISEPQKQLLVKNPDERLVCKYIWRGSKFLRQVYK